VEEGDEPGGSRRQRRILDARSLGFSFEIGNYQLHTLEVGHVEVEVAIGRIGQRISDGVAVDIAESVRDSLLYFEQIYGPYPLDHLVVVSVPRDVSQGLLGFITLSAAAMQDWEQWGELLGIEDRRTVIAHEVAHQWWGNLVGWRSYRDQWISEAMAGYSALLYARNRLPRGGESGVRAGPTEGWQKALLNTTLDGRTVESLGPVVMGTRLYSSLSRIAYQAIVYKKGAVVLDMLARFFTEDLFLRILREIVGVARDRLISTEDFLALAARLGGTDLTWFSDQYVFGTGLPHLYYSYRSVPLEDGRWAVVGEVTQEPPQETRHRVVQLDDGSLDVVREASLRGGRRDWVLVVPFQVGLTLDGGQDDDRRRVLVGRVVLGGEQRSFRLEFDGRPDVMWLDPRREVFGRFFSIDREPRRTAYQKGLHLIAEKSPHEAERVLLEALEAEVSGTPEPWRGDEEAIGRERVLLDASIHISLARLYLDTGRNDDAARHLAAVNDLVRLGDRWRFETQLLVLEERLRIRTQGMDEVFKSLRKGLLLRRGLESAEGYALLAIAARATGRTPEFETACRLARQRGVDMGPLECP
jgi:hypothetical protein